MVMYSTDCHGVKAKIIPGRKANAEQGKKGLLTAECGSTLNVSALKDRHESIQRQLDGGVDA
jgi:hypothetical protein